MSPRKRRPRTFHPETPTYKGRPPYADAIAGGGYEPTDGPAGPLSLLGSALAEALAPGHALTAAAVERIAILLERAVLVAEREPVDQVAQAPGSELLPVRSLSLRHIGCWIQIPPRLPDSPEPSIDTVVARLVGLRAAPRAEAHKKRRLSRVLVLQQGPDLSTLELDVDRPVTVAPRDWS